MTPDEFYDEIEYKISELENENMADLRIQQLLDIESFFVLQDYYNSKEYYETEAWDAPDVLVDENLWLDE